jgi:ketosteroid isomerase-like protein
VLFTSPRVRGAVAWRSRAGEGESHRLKQAEVLALPDGRMAVVVAPSTSTGYHEDGKSLPCPGRATLVFPKNCDAWLCTHPHMSLNRGVPQSSHANRPVKAW